MPLLAVAVERALKAAGIPVVGVSIGESANRATWTVQPANLQAAAQPTIDAFDLADPAWDAADLDERVKAAMDQERLTSAVVWTMIDQFLPPATIPKYNAARTKIFNFFRTQPWKP